MSASDMPLSADLLGYIPLSIGLSQSHRISEVFSFSNQDPGYRVLKWIRAPIKLFFQNFEHKPDIEVILRQEMELSLL